MAITRAKDKKSENKPKTDIKTKTSVKSVSPFLQTVPKRGALKPISQNLSIKDSKKTTEKKKQILTDQIISLRTIICEDKENCIKKSISSKPQYTPCWKKSKVEVSKIEPNDIFNIAEDIDFSTENSTMTRKNLKKKKQTLQLKPVILKSKSKKTNISTSCYSIWRSKGSLANISMASTSSEGFAVKAHVPDLVHVDNSQIQTTDKENTSSYSELADSADFTPESFTAKSKLISKTKKMKLKPKLTRASLQLEDKASLKSSVDRVKKVTSYCSNQEDKSPTEVLSASSSFDECAKTVNKDFNRIVDELLENLPTVNTAQSKLIAKTQKMKLKPASSLPCKAKASPSSSKSALKDSRVQSAHEQRNCETKSGDKLIQQAKVLKNFPPANFTVMSCSSKPEAEATSDVLSESSAPFKSHAKNVNKSLNQIVDELLENVSTVNAPEFLDSDNSETEKCVTRKNRNSVSSLGMKELKLSSSAVKMVEKKRKLNADQSPVIHLGESTPEKVVQSFAEGVDFPMPQMSSTPDSHSVVGPCSSAATIPSFMEELSDFKDAGENEAEVNLFMSPSSNIPKSSEETKKLTQSQLKFKRDLFQSGENDVSKHNKPDASLKVKNRKSYSPNVSVSKPKRQVIQQAPYRTKADKLIESMNHHFSEIEDMELCFE